MVQTSSLLRYAKQTPNLLRSVRQRRRDGRAQPQSPGRQQQVLDGREDGGIPGRRTHRRDALRGGSLCPAAVHAHENQHRYLLQVIGQLPGCAGGIGRRARRAGTPIRVKEARVPGLPVRLCHLSSQMMVVHHHEVPGLAVSPVGRLRRRLQDPVHQVAGDRVGLEVADRPQRKECLEEANVVRHEALPLFSIPMDRSCLGCEARSTLRRPRRPDPATGGSTLSDTRRSVFRPSPCARYSTRDSTPLRMKAPLDTHLPTD